MTSKHQRVALYARVSTSGRDRQNPEAQLRELREYAGRRGFVIYREYVDRVSGDVRRRKKEKAPEFETMMADARRRRFDVVLVWKYDRFARSLSALIVALQEFNDLGIDFISLTQQIDTTSALGRFFFHVVASFGELEREVIVERVRAGLANARSKGVRLGRPPVAAAAERMVRTMLAEGRGIRGTAREAGVSTSVVQRVKKATPAGQARPIS
jgi:DNA invertase Pin-like site-specific DNA recombinase